MKIFDSDTTRELMPFDRLIKALCLMFIEGCVVPTRHVHAVGPSHAPAGTVLIMPAWNDTYLGVKTVNIFPANAERGLSSLFSTYLLYDARTGAPVAQFDGNEITSRRTAAASALAASRVARPDASRLLVIGAGRVGQLIPQAYGAVLPIEEVSVWDRSEAQAGALVAELQSLGVRATIAARLDQAVAQADIVCCATLATTPVVQGAWLAEGSHLDLIGSFTPNMREADDACFAGARIYIDTEEALEKSGDLLGPISRGVFAPGDVEGTLASLCAQPTGSRPEGSRTVFKSVGTALEDLAAAILVYEAGHMTRIDTSSPPRVVIN
ncbi:bifunctional Delta(1)-pyrroline-2-carboxylate/Delta(1)-piperideine-2-carboxylate reductase [Caenimonas soli]|uniref:ornithine cyclodeaminase family protein n=1 Tax=Caenimonas soli TaxID=2735555 RepID=UPI001551E2E2|nr:ornithine cyclodeaminase family protein [Caenimonas soli]NPC56909.1 ornithine cyclodeaminase family protein [Caenimonas soli]